MGSSGDPVKEEQRAQQTERQNVHLMEEEKLAIGHTMRPLGHSVPRQGRPGLNHGARSPQFT